MKKNWNGALKIGAVSVLALGLFSAAFIGVNRAAFASVTGNTEEAQSASVAASTQLFVDTYKDVKASVEATAAMTTVTPPPAATAAAAATPSTADDLLAQYYADDNLAQFVKAMPNASADAMGQLLLKALVDENYPYVVCLLTRSSDFSQDVMNAYNEKTKDLSPFITDILNYKFKYGDLTVSDNGVVSVNNVNHVTIGDLSSLNDAISELNDLNLNGIVDDVLSGLGDFGAGNSTDWGNNFNKMWDSMTGNGTFNRLDDNNISTKSLDELKASVYDEAKVTESTFDNISSIDVSAVTDSISVTQGNVDKLTVRYSEWIDGECTASADNGKLTVKSNIVPMVRSGDNSLDSSWLPKYLQSLGKSYDKTVEIIIPASMSLDDVSLDTVAGNITVGGGTFGNLELSNVSGNVSVTDTAAGSLKISDVSGNISVAGGIFNSLKISDISGDSVLTLSDTLNNYKVAYSNVAGKFIYNGSDVKEKDVAALGNPNSAKSIDYSGISGSVTVTSNN